MRTHLGIATALLISAAVVGCQKESARQSEELPRSETFNSTTGQPVELPPPETFTWTTGQPVAFSPPPDTWKRSRYQNGGAEGVDFVLAGSKGEQIYVAERFFLGRRDHCARIREILDNLDNLDRRGFSKALQRARMYVSEPFNDDEEQTVMQVNDNLDYARVAFGRDDSFVVEQELNAALNRAAQLKFSVEETVGQVLFTREKNSVYPALEVNEPIPGTVAGEPALVVSFSFDGHGVPMIGRRIYVVKNNRMFEFGFQGGAERLALFDRIVESTTFPPGVCAH